MSFNIRKIYNQARSFLFSNMNKQLLVFLFFLLLSSIFWLLMTLNETYEQELNVPVQLTGVPEKVVITSDFPDTLKVILKDKGYTLIAYSTTHRFHPLSLLFASYASGGSGKGSVSQADLQKQLLSQLYTSTEIISVKPERIDFEYNFGQSKRVPVKLFGEVTPANNYYLAKTIFTPETVLVYGNTPQLDTLKAVYTTPVDVKDFEDTLTTSVRLQQPNGMKTVPRTVQVRFVADILTEESVDVPIVPVNLPENKNLRTFPNKVKVRFQIGASQMKLVKPSQFLVVVDYKEIMNNPSDKCKVHLRTCPKIASRPRLDFSEVDYIIEQ